jgi:hypothetical protein
MDHYAEFPESTVCDQPHASRALLKVVVWTQLGFVGLFAGVAAIALHVGGELGLASTVALLTAGSSLASIARDRVCSVLACYRADGRVRDDGRAILRRESNPAVAPY